MRYVSTRGQVMPIDFQDAVLMGLATDGGLLVPQSIPDVTDRLGQWRTLSYNDLAFEIFSLFISDIPHERLRELIDVSYGSQFGGDVAPVVAAGDVHILELFHGPTLAFKDIALQFLGNLFAYTLGERNISLNILGATSGDTGSAAIYGVRGRDRINIFIMHPSGGVSDIQEKQMTTVLDNNVHNLAIEGSFDDCQRIMKLLASDLDFKRKYKIGAVNSINWARVLAQIVYFFYGLFRVNEMTGSPSVQVAVPTGNFGDVLAGWYAKRMGLPISKLILATNDNDILKRFFNTGIYSTGEVCKTLSPAMDIQVASNFERYLYHYLGDDADATRSLMDNFAATSSLELGSNDKGIVDDAFLAGSASRDQTLATIAKYHREYDYLMDPHTAVGVAVAHELASSGEPVMAVSTAHPAKFPQAITAATGKDLAHHEQIDSLGGLPSRCAILPNDLSAVADFIIEVL